MHPLLMSWHHLLANVVCARFETDPNCGLSDDEVLRRIRVFGLNALPEEKYKSLWYVFLQQFVSPLIYILIASAVIAAALGKYEDALVILIVVLVNSLIGMFQEGRAERSMASLRKLSALHVRVLRSGKDDSCGRTCAW
jgi:magnesium-transporting ATPase (P-type)